MNSTEKHFAAFQQGIVGKDAEYDTPFGRVRMLYADWIASGRLYAPIEQKLLHDFGPFVGNTHTETSETGTLMTHSYHEALKIIKAHVNAGKGDVLLTAGFGMTAVVNKLQRILGLRNCGILWGTDCQQKRDRPVVFITHMEHHSNHTSWFETIADVVQIPPGNDLLVDMNRLEDELKKYRDRRFKIGSFTACSNVTGIHTPYHEMAKLMHMYGGVCFVDFAASAPYLPINMHPDDPLEKLDAIFFSPHKFLGGPGSSGIMVFDSSLYPNKAPDQPGGGTVDWTNPWGEYKYIDDIEAREDGGTPGFLQAIRAALSIRLKESMNPELIVKQEHALLEHAFATMPDIPGLHILAEKVQKRLGVISFYFEDIHYNLVVKLLNDRFGIQVRGGCACAGTYGHFLLDVSYDKSHRITQKITHGDLSEKPGWVRLSLHPTMTVSELEFIINALHEIALNHRKWSEDYRYSPKSNEFYPQLPVAMPAEKVRKWFDF